MSKKTIVLLLFVLAKFILQYHLINDSYELQRDEFLHLDQANHLAWGYISVPPATSWVSAIIGLLGNGVFWVRFFPALFGALTIVFVWKAVAALKGNMFALVLAATGVLLSALLRLNLLHQPNSLDVLCWTAFCFMLIKYIDTNQAKWLYTGAAVLGLGFLNKYSILFLLAGIIPALLITRQNIFKSKHFYSSIALFVLLILPNLFWQYHHNFPVYHHMQLLAKTQLVHVSRWLFLKEQVLFYIGSVFVIAAALYALLFHRPFNKYRFLFLTFCFTLLFFIYARAKSYYAMGLYPIYISFGAVYLEALLQTGWRKYLQPIAIIIPLLFFIPMYQFLFPNKSPAYIVSHAAQYKRLGLLRWEDGIDHELPQDYADMLGWKELAQKVDSLYTNLNNLAPTLILCDNYGQAGAINYYAPNKNMAAVSFNADYINWFQLDKRYLNLIRVKTAGSKNNELKETGPYFTTGYKAGSVTNQLSREYGTTIYAFKGATVNINNWLKKEIFEEKSKWRK